MNREAHVRFCESVEVKLPRATHQERQEHIQAFLFLAFLASLAVQSLLRSFRAVLIEWS